MLQLDVIMSSWTIALSPIFEFIQSILTNSMFPSTCHHSTLTKHTNISFWLFGLSIACSSHSFVTIIRTIFSKRIDFSASAFLALIIICTNLNLIFSWLDHKNNLCVDFLGVELNPYLYLEWLITVPSMFLLVTWYSLNVKGKRYKIIFEAICSVVAVFLLFLGNIPKLSFIHLPIFLLANILMITALVSQQLFTWQLHEAARHELNKVSVSQRNSELYEDLRSQFAITEVEVYIASAMSVMYCTFPFLYYLRLNQQIDLESFTILMYCASYFAKFFFSLLIVEKTQSVLDYSDLVILEDKKRQAASKQMLLRYVFHEIRVPLNSLSLGLQYLKTQDAIKSDDSLKDVVSMMAEGTSFMSETLNDVLSFQKIEDGAMALEKTWFDPKKLLRTIAATFK